MWQNSVCPHDLRTSVLVQFSLCCSRICKTLSQALQVGIWRVCACDNLPKKNYTICKGPTQSHLHLNKVHCLLALKQTKKKKNHRLVWLCFFQLCDLWLWRQTNKISGFAWFVLQTAIKKLKYASSFTKTFI